MITLSTSSPWHYESDFIFPFTIAILTATIGYVIYMHLGSAEKIRNYLSPSPRKNTYHVLFQRLAGIFIFGLLPALFIFFGNDLKMSSFGIAWKLSLESVLWLAFIMVIIIPMSYLNSSKADNLKMYPQIRKRKWSAGLLLVSALSWICYLLAYEFLFRGFLLFSSLEIIGYWPAILLNTGIYSLVHYPKGPRETYGAIPFGFLLCVLTIKTGSIWIALISHITLALSNEWFSLKANDKMKLIF